MAKGIDKKLDDAWSKAVKIRDNFECQYCRRQTTLNSHHIFSRRNRSTRWDLNNGITLCVSHHTFSSKFSAHGNGIAFARWLEAKMGKKWLNLLELKANQTVKHNKADKELILQGLLTYIKDNENL